MSGHHDTSQETYLGDGLYASFDGWQFKLRAPQAFDHDYAVYLEPSVLKSFNNYVKEIKDAQAKTLANCK